MTTGSIAEQIDANFAKLDVGIWLGREQLWLTF